jgi:methyl-accepting chemotaxis protein
VARAQVQAVQADTARYAAAFATLVQAARQVGLNENEGMLGALRTSVHDVEDRLKSVDVPKAQVAMLMMRRHEKDFMARLDPQYGEQLKARLPEFVAALDAATLDATVKAKVMSNMTNYQEVFASFLAGTLAEQGAAKALSAVYAEIEPRLAALDEHFVSAAARAAQQGEAAKAATNQQVLLSLAAIGLIVATLCGIVGRGIARPIIAVTRSMESLVKGDLDAQVPSDTRRDEIGTMVRAVRAFKDSLVASAKLRDEQASAREQAAVEKQAALQKMAEQIEQGATSSVQAIGQRTAAMIGIAEEMGALARRTGDSAHGAAEAAALAMGNAQTVASAAEQLSASIREISSQVQHSAEVVTQAVEAGNETRATIGELNERVGRIGAVADIIGEIAAKTNLLALNATIEAARAGEAGKGFAVVASEVKALANQTRRSTEEITTHISEVRAATAAAVTAVERIEATINEINGISGSIAAAVEQQGAATAEIARNVTQTATAVNEMSSMNAEVSREAEQAGHYAEDVLDNTRALDGSVADLKRAMIRTVRTSTEEVDRRMWPRYRVDRPCQVEMPGAAPRAARTADISEGGCWLVDLPGVSVGARGMLRVNGFPKPLAFRVLEVGEQGVHGIFDLDTATLDSLRGFLATIALPAAA